ncbi:MAG: YfiR family protein [Aquabacterium sp.]
MNTRPFQPLHAPRTTRRGWLALCLTLLFWTSSAACAAPAVSHNLESQIKAAFLYKFCAYVDWPGQAFERPDSPFVIGVIDSDAFADILEQTTAGRNVNGHPVEVRRLKRGASLAGVQIAFVAGPEAVALTNTVASGKGQSVLIVTEAERGLASGSMINFVLDQDKVRFDIAPTSAEQNNLKISSRLLNVARKVVVGRSS